MVVKIIIGVLIALILYLIQGGEFTWKKVRVDLIFFSVAIVLLSYWALSKGANYFICLLVCLFIGFRIGIFLEEEKEKAEKRKEDQEWEAKRAEELKEGKKRNLLQWAEELKEAKKGNLLLPGEENILLQLEEENKKAEMKDSDKWKMELDKKIEELKKEAEELKKEIEEAEKRYR